jgi:hypothetical protein
MASEPGSEDVPNEDWCGATPSAAVVLDGVTVPAVMEGGCSHGTPWYVRQLGSLMLSAAGRWNWPLTQVLAWAITATAHLHGDVCDLESEGAPSAAVAMLRTAGSELEYLVLADVTIALETAGGIQVITDGRVAASVAGLHSGTPDVGERIAERRAADRNRFGGYWVAAADPQAAANALTGSVPLTGLRRALVMTDGVSRLADLFGWRWPDVMALDPGQLVAQVRYDEARDPGCVRWPRFKVSDDATAILWQPGES